MVRIIRIIALVLVILQVQPLSAQKKPTLMILPSDNWCTQRYFTTTYNNQGVTERYPNYQQAFQEDLELGPAISKIGELLTKMGYSLKDAEMEIKNVVTRTAEDNVTFSKNSGAQFQESTLDILKRKAKADIIIQLDWKVVSSTLSFTIEAFDAYTSKRIATSSGTEYRSSEPLPIQLQKTIEKKLKQFDKQMDAFYSDIQGNGREIILMVRTWNSWDGDLEKEYDGEELLDCIIAWMRKNTIKQQFNLSDATENFAQFEQVRIPLENKKGMQMDARDFAKQLQKHLQDAPYNITSKVMVRGLGEAIVVLGEK